MTAAPSSPANGTPVLERRKPRLLTFCRFYLPGFKAGGPIQSIANLIARLSDEFEFLIVTSDRDVGDMAAYAAIESDAWQKVGGATVRYLTPQACRLGSIARIMRATPHDAVYLNSFMSWQFSTLPLLGIKLGLAPKRPVILAPRGEFSPGALAVKPNRKAVFLRAAAMLRLHASVMWHASTEYEAHDIRRATGAAQDIRVAGNIPVYATQGRIRHAPRSLGTPLRILFLGRVAPMKNLAFALDALARVGSPCEFTVAGVVDDRAYWNACQGQAARLGSHVKFRFVGPVSHECVPALLAEHDLMFLPTRGENFGHAILEAMAAGTPVLTSDQTPWRGLQARQLGWDLPLDDPGSFVAAIEEMARESPAEAASRRERCAAFAAESMASPEIELANRELFRTALGRS